jgi:hypothetical protein
LLENLLRLAGEGDTHPLLIQALDAGARALVPTVRAEYVFTDDKAPVEFIADSYVLRFLIGPDAEELRRQLIPYEEAP